MNHGKEDVADETRKEANKIQKVDRYKKVGENKMKKDTTPFSKFPKFRWLNSDFARNQNVPYIIEGEVASADFVFMNERLQQISKDFTSS